MCWVSEGSGAYVGTVVRIGAKGETPGERGLPKPERASARFLHAGVEGDFNVYRQQEKGGDPNMGVLLLPEETLSDLNGDGWPVRPGDLGENVTTSGIPYEALAPGRRIRIGEAVLETTKACDPCTNLYLLPYVGAERGPRFIKAMLGRRGWYARVVREGVVHRGDRIEVSPPPTP